MLKMAAILENGGYFFFLMANRLFLISDPIGKHVPKLVLVSQSEIVFTYLPHYAA